MAETATVVVESPEEAEGPPVNLDEAAAVDQQQPEAKPSAQASPGEVQKPTIEDELQQYKQRLIANDQARQQDAQRIANAERQTAEARGQAADGQYHMLRNAVEARQAAMDGVTLNLQKAWETGDFAAAAEQQKRLSSLAAEKTQYDMWLNQMEEQRKAGPQQQQPQPPQRQQQTADPVEQYLAGIADPKARDWLRSHPDCLPGQPLHNVAMAAHYDAMAKNLPMGTDAYWQHIETTTGYREAPKVTNASASPKRQASVAAPPSRQAPGLNGQQRSTGPRTITTRESDTARELGMTNEQYWEHKQGAIKDGNYYKPFNFPE